MRGRLLILSSLVLLACQKHEPEPPSAGATPPAPSVAPVVAPAATPPAATSWVAWTHPQKLVTVRFPGKPEETKQVAETPMGPVDFTMAIHASSTRAFMAGATVYKLPEGASFDVPKALDGARDKMLADINGKVTSEKTIELDGFKGREVSFEAPGPMGATIRGTARLFAGSDPPGAYMASAFRMTDAPDPDAAPFLDSMHLGKAVPSKQ